MKYFYFLITTQLIFTAARPSDTTIAASPSDQLKNFVLEASRSTEKIQLDLYVMSMCPFGIRAEQALIPLISQLDGRAQLNLHFIAEETSDHAIVSMHGATEVLEDRVQLVIARHYPEKLLDYLSSRATDFSGDRWPQHATGIGLDPANINRLLAQSVERIAFSNNIKLGQLNQITASPSLFVNGRPYKGSFIIPGKADAPGLCNGGSRNNNPCNTDVPGGCPNACIGGSRPGLECNASDPAKNCPTACDIGAKAGKACGDDSNQCPGTCVNNPAILCNGVENCGNTPCINKGTCSNTGTCTNIGTCEATATAVLNVFFSSQCEQGNVNLAWSAAAGMDPDRFVIESSADGTTWKDIGQVSAKNENRYALTDNLSQQSANFYRVITYEKSGTKIFSSVVGSPCQASTLAIRPNPVGDIAIISINGLKSETLEITVIDGKGLVIRRTKSSVHIGINRVSLDVSGLAAGEFVIACRSPSINKNYKIIKK